MPVLVKCDELLDNYSEVIRKGSEGFYARPIFIKTILLRNFE